ncbi:unnamed protein product [Acanthoscelides obtectus]|uniref:Uncharacterized protein n=1 Tax=Acanthoscelides obtectus TaxID=200917 RepID=A0A9P0MM63_ACAOB|nr:unnamed protein product [Acanthoscelides obtectus]CAK1671577.1 hypothetical protein AOBTE_LOCUS28334 [Acanthoscelides obtectus]
MPTDNDPPDGGSTDMDISSIGGGSNNGVDSRQGLILNTSISTDTTPDKALMSPPVAQSLDINPSQDKISHLLLGGIENAMKKLINEKNALAQYKQISSEANFIACKRAIAHTKRLLKRKAKNALEKILLQLK